MGDANANRILPIEFKGGVCVRFVMFYIWISLIRPLNDPKSWYWDGLDQETNIFTLCEAHIPTSEHAYLTGNVYVIHVSDTYIWNY